MQGSVTFCERNTSGVCTLGQEEEGQVEVLMLHAHSKRRLLAALETLQQGWGRQREGHSEPHPRGGTVSALQPKARKGADPTSKALLPPPFLGGKGFPVPLGGKLVPSRCPVPGPRLLSHLSSSLSLTAAGPSSALPWSRDGVSRRTPGVCPTLSMTHTQ